MRIVKCENSIKCWADCAAQVGRRFGESTKTAIKLSTEALGAKRAIREGFGAAFRDNPRILVRVGHRVRG
jgi:hypothetical protein